MRLTFFLDLDILAIWGPLADLVVSMEHWKISENYCKKAGFTYDP